MFYSQATGQLKTWSSHLEFDRVFCGQYWDDFACAGLLGDPQKDEISVLLLGLAEGAAIRPILASGRVKELVGVDVDGTVVDRCRSIYSAHFPEISFTSVVADAKNFLESSSNTFDVIVLDLYDEGAYSPLLFDRAFLELVRSRILPAGHVVLNAYGVPTHLRPFSGRSPQALLASQAQKLWGTVRYLPHRRNMTLVAGPCPEIPTGFNPVSAPRLNLGDRIALALLVERLRIAQKIPVGISYCSHTPMSYFDIDTEMRRRWLWVIPQLAARLVHTEISLKQPSDLRKLLASSQDCIDLQCALSSERNSLQTVLPILVAGEINCSDFDASWLPDWAMERMSEAGAASDIEFMTIVLPQAFSVVVNGKNKYRSRLFRFRDAIESIRSQVAPCLT